MLVCDFINVFFCYEGCFEVIVGFEIEKLVLVVFNMVVVMMFVFNVVCVKMLVEVGYWVGCLICFMGCVMWCMIEVVIEISVLSDFLKVVSLEDV